MYSKRALEVSGRKPHSYKKSYSDLSLKHEERFSCLVLHESTPDEALMNFTESDIESESGCTGDTNEWGVFIFFLVKRGSRRKMQHFWPTVPVEILQLLTYQKDF